MPPWAIKLLCGVTGVMIVAAGSAYFMHQYDTGQNAIALAAARANVIRVVEHQAKVNETVATQAQATHDRIIYRTQTLIREVPKYVTLEADRDCTVPVGFVRLWNAAGGLPASSASSDESPDAPSGVALSTVAATATQAGGNFQSNAEQLKALQDWAKQSGLMAP